MRGQVLEVQAFVAPGPQLPQVRRRVSAAVREVSLAAAAFFEGVQLREWGVSRFFTWCFALVHGAGSASRPAWQGSLSAAVRRGPRYSGVPSG